MQKLFHGHIKIISLVKVNMLLYFNQQNLRQTQDFKQRIAKHKSNFKNPHSSTCKIFSEHLRDDPYFQIFPFYYETNTALREHKEKRYIL